MEADVTAGDLAWNPSRSDLPGRGGSVEGGGWKEKRYLGIDTHDTYYDAWIGGNSKKNGNYRAQQERYLSMTWRGWWTKNKVFSN